MIGLRIRLLLNEDVLDEIELRDKRSRTEIRKIKDFGQEVSALPVLRLSSFSNTYKSIVDSYTPKLMSNEQLSLVVNSFLYDADKK
jgi:hypothetical protein